MQIAIELPVTHKDLPNHSGASQCSQCLAGKDCLHQVLELAQLVQPAEQYLHQVQLKKGQTLYNAGDPLTSICSLRSGYLKAEFAKANGQYQINHFAFPGDLIGINDIADGKRQLTQIALTDAKLCMIDYRVFNDLMLKHPAILSAFQKLIGKYLEQIENQLFCLGSLRVEYRLANFILSFYERHRPRILGLRTIRLPMGREDLCSYLGMTIETLSRAFAYLEKLNYLKVRNRNLVNIDYEGLQQLLEDE